MHTHSHNRPHANVKTFLMVVFISCSVTLFSRDESPSSNDTPADFDKLLEQYVESLGTGNIIFDASNIKQYWIDPSVLKQNNSIELFLSNSNNGFKSVLLPVSLINIDESQDCLVEVISDTADFTFNILDKKSHIISTPISTTPFLLSNKLSTSFHLEDTSNLSFNFVFESHSKSFISIKKIILSFTKNPESSFLTSPGKYDFLKDDLSINSRTRIKKEKDSLIMSGYQSEAVGSKKIFVRNFQELTNSVKIKNIGDVDVKIYIGYSLYTMNNIRLRSQNYPTSGYDTTLKVISSEDNSPSIITDRYEKDIKNFYFALNSKDDFSDIPTFNLTDGYIKEIKQIDENRTEFVLSKPIIKGIASGTKIRPQKTGGSLYTSTKTLHPDEEFVCNATLKQDPDMIYYSRNGIPKGVYYVRPVILSYSSVSDKPNTILISEYTISY